MTGSAAEGLWRARLEHTSVPRDFDGYPTSEDEGYAIQAAITAASGLDVIGWKIGATTAPLLAVIGVDQPFAGPLFAEFTRDNGAEFPIHPRQGLETEFTLRLKADLAHRTEPYGRDEVEAAIAAIIPSFEIIGFRFEGEPAGAGFRLIADGGANVGTVLGPEITEWDADALSGHQTSLTLNGEHVATGQPADLLWDHLFDAVGWLADQPVTAGRGLLAGDIIMTGTCTGMTPLAPGDEAIADFGTMGEVRAVFA